jgi:hypothetical protein
MHKGHKAWRMILKAIVHLTQAERLDLFRRVLVESDFEGVVRGDVPPFTSIYALKWFCECQTGTLFKVFGASADSGVSGERTHEGIDEALKTTILDEA